MLLTIGDLVEDVVVTLAEPINAATDTAARISRRRGGSAANVAAVAAGVGAVRFVGRVGDDAIGTALIADLAQHGVDVRFVGRGGSTGTIIALVDASGERSMLTDRGSCDALDDPRPEWLDDVDVVHLPLYSFASGAIVSTVDTVLGWARERDIAVSIDLSSTSLIRDMGVDRVRALIAEIRPDVVLANADEAAALDITAALGNSLTIAKHGREPTVVHVPGTAPTSVAVGRRFTGVDTTGAGDAFAAGFLTAAWREDACAAVAAGHAAAGRLLADRLNPTG